MKCKKCGVDLPAENINIQLAIAKCSSCNTVFSFYEEVADPRVVFGEDRLRKPLSDIGLPKGLSVEKTVSELRLRRRWFSKLTVFLTVFAAFWDGFLLIWFFIALKDGNFLMAAAGSLHAAVGLGLSYYVLAGYLNSTLVAVNRENLIIFHQPLPWPGTKTLKSSAVSQLYCRSVRSSSRSGTLSYEVRALLSDGTDVKLLSGLIEDRQALFIEQEVERYLRIEDRSVNGELK